MLEVTEQPIGYAATEKRKRQQEREEVKRVAEEAAVISVSTRDYAANLVKLVSRPWCLAYASAPAMTTTDHTPSLSAWEHSDQFSTN